MIYYHQIVFFLSLLHITIFVYIFVHTQKDKTTLIKEIIKKLNKEIVFLEIVIAHGICLVKKKFQLIFFPGCHCQIQILRYNDLSYYNVNAANRF